jgi:hypothetical protein
VKNISLILIALSLIAVLLLIVIIGPDYEAKILENSEVMIVESGGVESFNELSEGQASEISNAQTEPLEEDFEPENQQKFNLKYDKYLIEEPYTYVVNGEERTFKFDEMLKHIKVADQAISEYRLTYIDNYKNQNGYAPYYKGGSVDSKGNGRSASAPAYDDLSNLKEFIYLTDGTLVSVLEEDADYTLISPVGTDLEYSVPSKYVRTEDCLISLEKAIIVDITNQNIATFEKEKAHTSEEDDNVWYITSYSMSTTGKSGKYHQPTPLGYFYAIQNRERFYYLKDGTNTIEGYAPYAVRFTAGAYIHGIATAYKYTEDGHRIDPGIKEFSSTIGTVPLSHKCVRNYTSHAKFVYDWYEHAKTIVIVI